ncbi:unnamed protein product [Lepidochelys kempii]
MGKEDTFKSRGEGGGKSLCVLWGSREASGRKTPSPKIILKRVSILQKQWWERREARQTLTVHSSWVHSRPKVLQDDRNMVCMDVVPSIPWDSKGRLHKSQRHLAFSVYINI